jgi:hypothetical protein
MSDHLKLTFTVEIYDRANMEFNGQGMIVSDAIKNAIKKRMYELGFKYKSYYISGGL